MQSAHTYNYIPLPRECLLVTLSNCLSLHSLTTIYNVSLYSCLTSHENINHLGFGCCCLTAACFSWEYRHRPRSIEAISNGTLPNNRQLNGVVSRGSGGLHEDADFPPNPKTLSRRKPIVWLRPHVSTLTITVLV